MSADRTELAVVEAGDPERATIVFVHGYPDTKELWQGVMGALEDRFHLVAYDVRGAGASDVPRSRAAYDFDRLSEDFEAVIDATAPGKRVHLVGHDWGGLQGWEFATRDRFRDRLSSYTAVAGPSLDQVAVSAGSQLRGGRPLEALRRGWRSWYILVLLSPGGPQLMSWMMVAGGAPPGTQSSLARDAINGANLYRRNIPRRMAKPRRDAFATVPVQLIIPSGDRYIPMSYYELAEQHAPTLQKRVVEGSHWLPRTKPELVADMIASFVDQV